MINKILKSFMVILLLMIGIFSCYGLYYLMDNILNGNFVDWFSKNYMTSYQKTTPNGTFYITEPYWYKLKMMLLIVLNVSVVSVLLIIVTVSSIHARRKVNKSVTATSRMIHQYMMQEKDAREIFPKEYAEISAQMVEIKSTMRRHEQILKEEARRKNDLITYLAHDLKTPLTSVIGYLDLLSEAPDMPPKQNAKYVNIALSKAYRLEKLIQEFFEITRYNLQQIVLEKETIDLYYMLVQMTDEFYPILNAHGNTAKLTADEDLTVYGDPMKLARVFNNILKNAAAYSYPDTAIEIKVQCSSSEIHITFQNRGKTIPRQKLDSIFEKFFRLDDARATNTGGAGLGLAIAREIVTLHGGSITATSENEITVFSVTLPLL